MLRKLEILQRIYGIIIVFATKEFISIAFMAMRISFSVELFL